MIPNPQSKQILCYGDSNTWGQSPHAHTGRFAVNERWTGVAQEKLGDSFAIIEEGLSGRTTNLDYTQKPGLNGWVYFRPCLETHDPLDLVVIMLGTNDVKIEFGPRPALAVAEALEEYITDVQAFAHNQDSEPPRIALISPIHIDGNAPMFAKYYAGKYDQRSIDTVAQLAPVIQKLAGETGCFFFDAAKAAHPGEDGIHIDLASHKALGDALAVKIMEWLA